jgi:hypothetical protein
MYCGATGVSNLQVMNPSSSSVYTWSTTNGNIVGTNNGTSITVDAPGTYVVHQRLADGCNVYATDTILITFDATCVPMDNRLIGFSGSVVSGKPRLAWIMEHSGEILSFTVQRSADGSHFSTAATLKRGEALQNGTRFGWDDEVLSAPGHTYYRLQIRLSTGKVIYSDVIRVAASGSMKPELVIYPNPAVEKVQLLLPRLQGGITEITITHAGGGLAYNGKLTVSESNTVLVDVADWAEGIYFVQVKNGAEILRKKLIIRRN